MGGGAREEALGMWLEKQRNSSKKTFGDTRLEATSTENISEPKTLQMYYIRKNKKIRRKYTAFILYR